MIECFGHGVLEGVACASIKWGSGAVYGLRQQYQNILMMFIAGSGWVKAASSGLTHFCAILSRIRQNGVLQLLENAANYDGYIDVDCTTK